MVRRLTTLTLLLLGCSVWAQNANRHQAGEATIERVKALHVSALDRDLPDVTLEFFLNYEAGGAPIQWGISDCLQVTSSSGAEETKSDTCVQAHVDLKDSRSATVVVFTSTAKPGAAAVPKILTVTVTDPNGAIHDVPRLHDLPMELHRPLPKGPRDLPLPAGATMGARLSVRNS